MSIIILATNRVWEGDVPGHIRRRLGLSIRKDYVTWGGSSFDWTLCMDIPKLGYYRRDHEQAVLPHAIGCQAPTRPDEYVSILKGQHDLKFQIKRLNYKS